MHKSNRLTVELHRLEQQNQIGKALGEAKDRIWKDIKQSINEMWSNI